MHAMNQGRGEQRGQQVITVIGQRKVKLLGQRVAGRAAFDLHNACKGLRPLGGFLCIAAQGVQRSVIFYRQTRQQALPLVLEFQKLENIKICCITHYICFCIPQAVCPDHKRIETNWCLEI